MTEEQERRAFVEYLADAKLEKNASADHVIKEIIAYNPSAYNAWMARASLAKPQPVGALTEPAPTIAEVLHWAASMATFEDPRTSDWRYDDRNDLANAIQRGPESWSDMLNAKTQGMKAGLLALSHQIDDAAQGITEEAAYEFATYIRILIGIDGDKAAQEALATLSAPVAQREPMQTTAPHFKWKLEGAISWVRNNYQDHNIGSLCDGIRQAFYAPEIVAVADDDEIWGLIKGIPFDWTGDSDTLIRYARAILALATPIAAQPAAADPSYANACLIAAAPCLLAALSEFVDEHSSHTLTETERLAKARAAIARALPQGAPHD